MQQITTSARNLPWVAIGSRNRVPDRQGQLRIVVPTLPVITELPSTWRAAPVVNAFTDPNQFHHCSVAHVCDAVSVVMRAIVGFHET